MIGDNIKRLRQQKGLSQKQIAEIMDMSYQNIGKWETGAVEPPISKLTILAQVLGTTLETILGLSLEKTTSKVLSFVNQKGGTGKTTIAIALATMYATTENAKVCIIDCDFQQSAVKHAELEEQVRAPIVDVISLPVHQTKRFVLTFTNLLEKCKDEYDLVFVDTMGSFHDLETIGSIISLSDIVVIPIEPTVVALQSSVDSIALVKEIQRERKSLGQMPLRAKGIISKATQTLESKDFVGQRDIEGLEMFVNPINFLAVYHKELSLHAPIQHKNFIPVYNEFKELVQQ